MPVTQIFKYANESLASCLNICADDIHQQHLVIRFLHHAFVFNINMFLSQSATTASPPQYVRPMAQNQPAEVAKQIAAMRFLH
jgi:hypothetical protein